MQIAEKRREVKGKGGKGRYTHLNAEFQRIARRYKNAFLSDQCKEIEENNRIGKTRDLFKKIRDTKGTFHAKMDTIKERNSMGLTEAEDTKKRAVLSRSVMSKTLCDPMHCSPQVPLSMGFSRQEYWNRLPFPPPGDLPTPGIETKSPASPALAGRCFATVPPGKPQNLLLISKLILGCV